MTRFQSRALPAYKPQPYQSGLAGLMTAYGMWQSLSPETRDKIIGLFQKKNGDVAMINPAIDTRSITEVPEFGTDDARHGAVEAVLGTEMMDEPEGTFVRRQPPAVARLDWSLYGE